MSRCPVCDFETEKKDACPECGWEFRVYLSALSENGLKKYERDLARARAKTRPPEPGEAWTDPLTGIVFVWIPGGIFFRRRWKKGPLDEVRIRGFRMGRYPVTRAQWVKVMEKSLPGLSDPACPVDKVAWIEVEDFLFRLNRRTKGPKYRLPTEAEWEYACHGGGDGAFCFGDDETRLVDYAWYEPNARNQTHPVGLKKPNAWGLHDLHGNVAEWCGDWYDRYPLGIVENPAGPVFGSCRVYRGGSYENPAGNCRCDFRNWEKPGVKKAGLGFRLALSRF